MMPENDEVIEVPVNVTGIPQEVSGEEAESLFSKVLEAHRSRDKEKELRISLPSGAVLCFRQVRNSADLQMTKKEVEKIVKSASKRMLPMPLQKFIDERAIPLPIVAQAEMLYQLMTACEVEGKRGRQWSRKEWLQFADEAPLVFDGIANTLDNLMIQITQAGDVEEVERRGEG